MSLMTASNPLVVTGEDLIAGGMRDQVVQFIGAQGGYHFTQHPDWACLQNPHDFIGVGTWRCGALVAWTLVRKRRMPVVGLVKYFGGRGPVVTDSAALLEHVADLERLLSTDGLFLVMHPYQLQQANRSLKLDLRGAGFMAMDSYDQYYSDTLTIDLTQDIGEIQAAFRKSLIRQLNKSTRAGITVTEVVSDEDKLQFCSDYTAEMSAKKLGVLSNFQSVFTRFCMPPEGFALQAIFQGKRVAGIALVGGGTNIVYEWGYTSSRAEHRSLPLHHVLHWQAIQRAKREGFTCYDMGGYWSELCDSDPINRFKLGFTQTVKRVGSPIILCWRPRLAKLLSREWS